MPPSAPAFDRPEVLSAVTLRSGGQLFRLTPYWRVGCLATSSVARRAWLTLLPLSRYRQPPVPLVTMLLVGVPPYAGFVLWMLDRARDVATADLLWRMWLAGLWILASPGLIVAWERRFLRLHRVLVDTAATDGWNVDKLVGVDRIFAKLWWGFVGAAGIATVAGYVTGLPFLQYRLGAAGPGSPYFWLGLAIVTMVGVSFGVGIWGVAKTLVYSWVALDSDLSFDPFRPKQPDGFEELTSFTFWTGLLYSLGSVLLPGTYLILSQLPLAGQVIGILFAGCLLLGGAAVFVLPSLWMSQLSRELKLSALDRYTTVLNQLSAAALAPSAPEGRTCGGVDPSRLSEQVAAVTSLRALVASDHATPSVVGIGARVFAIFVAPVAVSAIQTITGIG